MVFSASLRLCARQGFQFLSIYGFLRAFASSHEAAFRWVTTMSLLDQLKFDDKGLVAAIARDADNGDVLMMAWMNAEAVRKTLETGKVHYWS